MSTNFRGNQNSGHIQNSKFYEKPLIGVALMQADGQDEALSRFSALLDE
jgi:hypothetical protein